MAVLQMQKIHICARKKHRKPILEYLQRQGKVQLCPQEASSLFSKTDTAGACTRFEKNAQTAMQALKILDKYAPEKKGLLASFEGKRGIGMDAYHTMERERAQAAEKANKILELNRQIAEQQGNYLKAQLTRDTLVPWLSLDIPMNSRGTKATVILLGTLPGVYTLEDIYAMVARATPYFDTCSIEILSSDTDQTCLFCVCPAAQAAALEEALRQNGFSRPSLQTELVPAEFDRQLAEEMEEAARLRREAEAELAQMGDCRRELELLYDYYLMRKEKYEVLGELVQSDHVFFLEGYVPARVGEKLSQSLTQRFECVVELEDAGDNPPVLLQNNAFSAPTEGVLSSFGLPKPGEMDPTSIMSICYYFLFGLMLSDAAYGLVMALGCFILVKKFPRMAPGTKGLLTMFIYCGISTMFWGVMFGSYFGDAITVIAKTFFNKDIVIPAVWLVPMDEPMRMLIFCFLFGIVHLFLGLALKGYMLLKEKQVMDFFCDVVLWFLLLIGLLLMLLPSELFVSISQMEFNFPPFVGVLAKGMAIVGAVGIIVFAKRSTKNFGVRLALGAYELYGATSWLSDVLSYSRLLALGLATGVIASVINQMGAMVGSGVVGAIAFILVFLIGHTLNLAINVLGAYVHTNRLQFVEFFGKFYEGGGSPFRPFHAATKYTTITEDNEL